MNVTALVLDVVIAAIFIISIFRCVRQGFIKSTSAILSIVLTIFLMFAFNDGINSYLTESDFGVGINEKITESLVKNGFNADGGNETQDLGLPEFLEPIILDAQQKVGETANSLLETVAEGVTAAVINVISILLLYILVKVLLFVILRILNLIFKLPLLKSINKIAGLGIGVVNALFIVYILCAGLIWFGPADIASIIDDTFITHYFYNNNLLLNMFM